MSTFEGSTVGAFSIERELGRGGMGVVYLGRDTRLDRAVAVKTLPEHLADAPERLSRFEREAKILASLTHANIAGVYGLEEQDGSRYLVMEYVEGETLAALIDRGPIAVDEALRIAVQVASGIEAAHDAGVIHRDLKPGNVVVTLQGQAKVLDFGLAKEVESRGSSLDLSRSPTMTTPQTPTPRTTEGQIVGTAAYLSPEQARGKALDKRTDIWAFGCVLYEMLTGVSPFAGDTATDSIGAILHKEPNWSLLPADTPATIQLLLRRCLAKDPNRRLRDIGDARVEIEEALRDPSNTSLNLAGAAMASVRAPARSRLAWAVAGLLAVVAAGLGAATLLPSAPDERRPIRLNIERGVDGPRIRDAGAEFAISPDGSTLAFIAGAGSDTGTGVLHVRPLNQFEATPLSGTEGAMLPFFSPDGEWVGFFAQGKLKKIAVTGGAPLTLCDAPGTHRGASWGDSGEIAFTPDTTTGVWLVSENGGEPRQLTTPSEEADERSHRWPHFLPGGEVVLFASQVRGNDFDQASIEALVIETGERTVLHQGGSNPKYAASGHLVFGRAGTLYAAPFDPDSLSMLSAARPVLEGVTTAPPNGGVEYALSGSGALVYGSGEIENLEAHLEWANRDGERRRVDPAPFKSEAAQLSPDGSRVALQIYTEGSAYDIWIYEIQRAVLSRLTFDEQDEMNPIWSPDGSRVAYAAIAGGEPKVFVQRADGSGEPRRITMQDGQPSFPVGWSPDGARIAYMQRGDTTGFDLWTIAVDEEDAEAEEYLATRFEERYPVFSPDGGWIAYTSMETGRPEIYVRSYPRSGGRWQVSIDGGTQPVWSADGAELFFTWNDTLYAAPVSMEDGSFSAGSPAPLFEHEATSSFFYPQYSVDADAERFLLLTSANRERSADNQSLSLILNWFTELKERAAP